ncbi:hypothetical protein CPB84DRAFT_1776471 [Gymnopilus junonius]|uniref:Protein OS-9 homolog n=1 Tax=Gymnopilus junonius TaxID=109634 RepID=A0A9P5NRA1_GYMJU|nr:hypothetical protein CPB84DRAFT_1776471 [Gymnopilus junonius]
MRLCILLASCLLVVSARLLHSLPEDTYAFPKYRVSFLNGLPVLNETAERWLREGLRGGEQEFLDQPWKHGDWVPSAHLKEIGSGDPIEQEPTPPSSPSANYTIERMAMGSRDSYVCLIPKPLDNVPVFQDDDSDADVTPARSWSLLQPLTGTCLYHRQGWFTYSYCHNDEIRQFKETAAAQTRFPGTYKPEEDPGWDSYTLGRAPRNPEPGADLTVAEQNAQAANLELARNAGSRYLVQRWGDGTICDKTLQSREVEVQFHCSMEMTDHILFVKETKTCSYIVVIHTPRLCGEPGFKSRRDAGGEAEIRCREVVDVKPEGQVNLPAADHPLKFPLRKTVLPAPASATKGQEEDAVMVKENMFNDLLRKTLEAIVGRKGTAGIEDNELVIELVDDVEESAVDSGRLVDALRAAGYNVEAQLVSGKAENLRSKDDKKPDKNKKEPGKKYDGRDEL